MELVIKIPDEVYKTVLDGSYCGSLYEELKAARPLPYEPSEDLISRSDALKAVDSRHEELLHDPEYCRKHCQIDLVGIKKHILAIPPANVFKPAEGDLISREALKDITYINKGNFNTVEGIREWIDNAQVVEYAFLPQYQADLQCAYDCGYEKGKQDRPQGEWIFDSEHTEFGNPYGTYKCNKCGGHSSDKYPFCFWCGADMRKGGAE